MDGPWQKCSVKALMRRVFCYANADVSKRDQNDEILRIVDFWQARTGHLPAPLIFDSKLTTYANLDTLNRRGIHFITLRRRGKRSSPNSPRRPRRPGDGSS